MGLYDFKHFTIDFSRRTLSNLRLVRSIASKQRNRPKIKEKDRTKLSKTELTALEKWEQNVISIVGNPCFSSFEVTQLLLSMYGLLLIPFEKYKNDPDISKASLEKTIKNSRWHDRLLEKIQKLENDKRYRNTYDYYEDPVYTFFRHLRNSLSHEGIHFLPIGILDSQNIEEIIFYDYIKEDSVERDDCGNKLKYTFENSPQKFCLRVNTDELTAILGWIDEIYKEVSFAHDTDDSIDNNQEGNIKTKLSDEERYKIQVAQCEFFLNSAKTERDNNT